MVSDPATPPNTARLRRRSSAFWTVAVHHHEQRLHRHHIGVKKRNLLSIIVSFIMLLVTLIFVAAVLIGWGVEEEACDDPPGGDGTALLDYASFYSCSTILPKWLKILLLILWLLLIISLLATTADNFFVPQLEALSEDLGLSEDVAGATLLALGNGMPDVMTATSAINKAGDFPLSMGEFLGAANFIVSFVLGCVLLCKKPTSQRNPRQPNAQTLMPGAEIAGAEAREPAPAEPAPAEPAPADTPVDGIELRPWAFCRDCVGYTLVLVLMTLLTRDDNITLGESFIFFGAYALYIAAAVLPGRCRSRNASTDDARTELAAASEDTTTVTEELEEPEEDFLEGIEMPASEGPFELVQLTMELPFTLLRHVSIPASKWNPRRRWLAAVCPTFGLIIALLAFDGGWECFHKSWGPVPLWLCSLIAGIIAGVAVLIFSKPDSRPCWHVLLLLFAFVSVVGWFNLLANECVAVLETLGENLGISSSVMGITVLAWGNSVGDLVADTALARSGKHLTAVAGCFSSPLLSDLLGLGVALSSYTITNGTLTVQWSTQNQVAAVFLLVSLMSTLIACCIHRLKTIPRRFAYVLIAQYLAFMVASVWQEVRRH